MGSLRGGLSYVRRDSESSDIKDFQSFRSNAIDGLIGASASFEVAKNTSLVLSYDHYTNLLNDIASSNFDIVESIEETDYSVVSIGLKFNFN